MWANAEEALARELPQAPSNTWKDTVMLVKQRRKGYQVHSLASITDCLLPLHEPMNKAVF